MNSKSILRNYIRSILREAMPVEKTMTSVGAPPESSTRQVSKATSTKDKVDVINTAWTNADEGREFSAMQAAAEKLGLELIGQGTSRIVYDLGGDYVIKLALRRQGVAQNELEATAGRDPHVDRIVTKVIDNSVEYAWLVSEKAIELTSEKEFEDIAGVEWNDLLTTLGFERSQSMETTAKPKRGSSQRGSGSDAKSCLKGNDFLEYLRNFLIRYSNKGGFQNADFTKFDSWGRTKDGCIVLLDYGISKQTFKKMYDKSGRPIP